ncbi:MAG: glycoside hydrolase family 15 protein [Frankiaceae bacterium]|nr:glycoside hydrolase family 15 protein [Frankiaceae bacterium]MBV9871144.1 glycoside hydrolase family 15 protein [Frankiaceae bacterium]
MRPRREDGYAPIEDYAAIGDGRTVALVAADGCIDWWPVTRLDATPSFARLLDADRGGTIRLTPTEAYDVDRRYVEDTNVVETVFTTATGSVRVTDAIPMGRGGQLSWSQLVRRIDGVAGQVELEWSVEPGSRLGQCEPRLTRHDGAVVVELEEEMLAVQAWRLGEPDVSAHAIRGRVVTKAGNSAVLVITGGADSPVVVPTCEKCLVSVDVTIDRWQEWSRTIDYDGPWREVVRRSALALKLLAYSPTGAIAAAPTTSLPERIGGAKNWDYRFMWVRDAAFTIDAMLTLGLHDEAHAAVKWMLGALRETEPDLRVFYSLDGREPDGEHEADAAGYRNSKPVRVGNRAAKQTQLGTFGDLFDMLWLYVQDGHRLDRASARLLTNLADRCCDIWHTKGSGIWELQKTRHYTVEKIGCWTALDRAIQLADAGQLEKSNVKRWARERDRIKKWTNKHCWSDKRNSYTAWAGT